LCLLDIPVLVHETIEFGIYRDEVVALAIAQLHFGGDLRDDIGLLEGSTMEDMDRLTGDFDAATNVVFGEVSV
jgi:hypothetical protein